MLGNFKNTIKQNFELYSILLFASAFCFIIFPKALPLLIYVFFAYTLFKGNLLQRVKLIKFDLVSISMILFFLWHVVGLFYSSNIGFGMMDFEIKLPLLLLPLSFLLIQKKLSPKSFDIFFYFYSLSGFIYIIYCFVHAFLDFQYYIVAHNLPPEYTHSVAALNYFTKYFLSPYHTTYISMHYCVLVIYWFLKSVNENRKYQKYLSVFTTIIFSIFIFFLYSKAGIISIIFIYVTFLFYLIFKFKKYFIGLISFASMLVFLIIAYKSLPNLSLRINSIVEIINDTNAQVEDAGTQRRVESWKASKQIIKDNFIFGVGTGDIKDELLSTYLKNRWFQNYAYKLNSHSQFLQTFAALGFLGFLLFLLVIYSMLYFAKKHKSIFLFLLVLIVFINSAFESILEVQVGTVFFAFIICFLVFNIKDNDEYKPTF